MLTTTYMDELLLTEALAPGPPPLILDTFHASDGTELSTHTPDTITSPAAGPWFPLAGQVLKIVSNELQAAEPSFTRNYVSYLIDGGQKNVRQSMRFRFNALDTVLQPQPSAPGCIGGPNLYGRAEDSGGGDFESNSAYVICDGFRCWHWQLSGGILMGLHSVPLVLVDGQVFDLVAEWAGEHLTAYVDGVQQLSLDVAHATGTGARFYGTTMSRMKADCSTSGPIAQSHLLSFRLDAL